MAEEVLAFIQGSRNDTTRRFLFLHILRQAFHAEVVFPLRSIRVCQRTRKRKRPIKSPSVRSGHKRRRILSKPALLRKEIKLQSVGKLTGKAIHASDGELGKVDQFLFDDESWTIRYLVVSTGAVLGRNVLISPISIDQRQMTDGLRLSLTKEQIRNSPDIDTDKPVSRQHEAEYFNYYGYPYYWGGTGLWGAASYPLAYPPASPTVGYPDRVSGYSGTAAAARAQTTREEGDQHLRSTKEVIGYYIEANDGNIGHVEDFLLDDENWAIRYIVVDTVNWWPGKKVVINPQWIKDVSWADSRVYVDLSRDRIKTAPEYDPDRMIDREYENELHDYYRRPKYRDESTLI